MNDEKIIKVALYARVSSEQQAESELSIAAQLKALKSYAERNGWTIYKEFIDEAESARTANRPAFQEMIAYAKRKEHLFSIILVWKYSRFARNREDAAIYKSLLRKHGVNVISINEPVDDSPSGKLLEGMIEVIDEFYSANLSVDTVRGLRENAERGFKNGSMPIGYKAKKVADGNNQRTKLEPEDLFSPIIKRMFQMSIEGKGIKEIVKVLNSEGLKTHKGKPWSTSTVSYILKNEVYVGTLVYGKKSKNLQSSHNPQEVIKIENNHPALVSKEMFNTVQELIRKRSPKITHPRETASEYLLSGLLWCGKCQAKMIGNSAKSGKHFYYACHNHVKRGKSVCDAKSINKGEIESLIINRLKTHVLTEENLTELFNIVLDEMNNNKSDAREQLQTLDKQQDALKERLGKLYNSLESGKLDIDDLAPRIKELKGQINILETRRNQVTEGISNSSILPFNLKNLKAYVEDLADLLRKGTIMEQKSFLRSFIKRIIVNHPEVTIEYKIPIIKGIGVFTESEVLSIDKTGSEGRARTYDQSVNSRPLYH